MDTKEKFAKGAESSQTRRAEPLSIFINYRRSEAGGWARLLYEGLARRFGADHVFLDVVTLQPGDKWLTDIRSRSTGSAAFIALIGPKWVSTLKQRAGSPEEDQVRAEIEQALRKDSRVEMIVPALIDDAEPPAERDLPRPLVPLLHRQVVELRPSRWDADVQELIEDIENFRRGPKSRPEPPGQLKRRRRRKPQVDPDQDPIATPPDRGHYDELVRLIVEDGSVVPFLGPGANSSDRDEPWQDVDTGSIPDADELAAYLANKLDSTTTPTALAKVAEHLLVAQGTGVLYRTLRRALPSHSSPSSVHRFLADFPARMLRLGLQAPPLLIVTTNYDDALEKAFDDAEEPYDLAVYIASGPDKGGFAHIPFDGEPHFVGLANQYRGFPVNEYGEVTRTVIMKIHGAADAARGPYSWRDNYVITEDDYIEYLSDRPISEIVPQELLGKLKESHLLFLGYTMRDWNLRVFLRRIFGDHLRNTSWAIQSNPAELDRRFWKWMGVDLFAVALESYLDELGSRVAVAATATGSDVE